MKRFLVSILVLMSGAGLFAQGGKTSSGFTATVNDVDITVSFYSPKIVRVLKSPAGTEFEKQSLSVIKTPEKVDFTYRASGNVLSAQSSELKVSLDTKTGRVDFETPAGKHLLSEKDYGVQFLPMTYTSREFVQDALAAGAYGYSPAMQGQGAPAAAAWSRSPRRPTRSARASSSSLTRPSTASASSRQAT